MVGRNVKVRTCKQGTVIQGTESVNQFPLCITPRNLSASLQYYCYRLGDCLLVESQVNAELEPNNDTTTTIQPHHAGSDRNQRIYKQGSPSSFIIVIIILISKENNLLKAYNKKRGWGGTQVHNKYTENAKRKQKKQVKPLNPFYPLLNSHKFQASCNHSIIVRGLKRIMFLQGYEIYC